MKYAESKLVREIRIQAPRELVFGYFTDPGKLIEWIGMSAELDPRPYGTFRFEVATGEFCSGRYIQLDPPRRLAFTWGWESATIPLPPGSSVVEVELHEVGSGVTQVVLTHSGLSGDVYELHDEGWQAYLARLQAACEGRDPGPDPAARTPQEALAKAHQRRGDS